MGQVYFSTYNNNITISTTEDTKSSLRWCLNNSFLNSEEHCDYIRKVIKEFLEFNVSIKDAGITWDAFKAFVRGLLFSIQ